jgi:hypothetical protein
VYLDLSRVVSYAATKAVKLAKSEHFQSRMLKESNTSNQKSESLSPNIN